MLVLKILVTLFVSFSCFTGVIKNIGLFANTPHEIRNFTIYTICEWLWKAFVIVTIWLV